MFSDRYLLAQYPSGGVAVDLVSGNYFRLNRSATVICDVLRSTDSKPAACLKVSALLHISRDEAAQAIGAVMEMLSTGPVHGVVQGAYHFYPATEGYTLCHGERRVLQVDDTTLAVRLGPDAAGVDSKQLELYARALAPKILFNLGITVLHASACVVDRRLIAFAGLSGAGKTTTARAFREAGCRIVSEDLVVLSPSTDSSMVILKGEDFITAWAGELARRLVADRRGTMRADDLKQVDSGGHQSLDAVLFLDASRRHGLDFVTKRLTEPDGLTNLLTHDFLGARGPQAWARFFETAVKLITHVRAEETTAPLGLGNLAAAARRYASKTAS